MRKLCEVTNAKGDKTVRIFKSEDSEYVLKFWTFANGEWKYNENADYFTDDKIDALSTANHWLDN